MKTISLFYCWLGKIQWNIILQSHNMEHIFDADYVHADRVWKDFEIQNSLDYHDLYVQSDKLLLGDVF